ncbi:MAG TPA: hypothetical protein VFS21_30540 [Roseiflexaceae bacterium]|nr:hypothetical protein [Roseiflexaceae bacterium]
MVVVLLLRYAELLDSAVEQNLLRRVGGSWAFAHPLLLDYFAGLGVPLPERVHEQSGA